ncbi:MAG: DUF3488 and transglutaminase-like domain-containing protein [Myxococcota bacterium]
MSEPSETPWLAAGALRKLRDGLSVAQVLVALAGVALAGGVGLPSLVLFFVLLGLAWWRPLPPIASKGSQRAWTLLIFVALVATLLRAVLRAEFLDAGVDFLLLLVVQRMFNRQRAREHAQMLLLGTLLLVVGAVINTELSYPALLAVYFIVATMALLVNTLMSEGERLGSRVMLNLGRQAHRRRRALWRAAIGVAVMAGAGAFLTFLLFPRWGVGVFLRGRLPGETRSGFSDDVTLGDFGTIKTDASVVMRIRPDNDPGVAKTDWHLRGTSLDFYDEGHWKHGPQLPSVPLRPAYGFHSAVDSNGAAKLTRERPSRDLGRREVPGFPGSTNIERASILVEDFGADLLFVPSEPVAVKLTARGELEKRTRILGGRNGEIRVNKLPGPIQYRAMWRKIDPTRSQLQAVGSPQIPERLDPYLQRSDALSPQVTELARRLTDGAPHRLAKVEAVAKHLQGFDYTLDQTVSDRVIEGADPVEGFLFDTQAGHCEYFATAMAVLLREADVPTRIVNGYYGAHLNEIGGFYTVRQANAHSWVEVHFGELGWVTFDPTPPAGRTAGDDAPWWPAANELLDALRNTYLEYVIDYDLSKQLAIFEQLGFRRKDNRPRGTGPWIVVGLVIGLGALWVLRRWRRGGRDGLSPETQAYLRVLARLDARGFTTTPDQSPLQIAEQLAEQGHPAHDVLQRFLTRYEALRFGPRRDPQRLAELRADAKQALAALKRVPRPPAS